MSTGRLKKLFLQITLNLCWFLPFRGKLHCKNEAIFLQKGKEWMELCEKLWSNQRAAVGKEEAKVLLNTFSWISCLSFATSSSWACRSLIWFKSLADFTNMHNTQSQEWIAHKPKSISTQHLKTSNFSAHSAMWSADLIITKHILWMNMSL